jgi:hypothetical protein
MRQVCRCWPWCSLLLSPSVHTLVAILILTLHLWSHGDGSLPLASTPTAPQQGEAGMQVPALVWPPAEPLYTHPSGHPAPNTTPPVARDGSLPPAPTFTALQQGEVGVQMLALVQPPAEPLCVRPGGHPAPNTAPLVAWGWLTAPRLDTHGAIAG